MGGVIQHGSNPSSRSRKKVSEFSKAITRDLLEAVLSWSRTIIGKLVIGRDVAQPSANNSIAPPISIKAGSHQSFRRCKKSLIDMDQILLSIDFWFVY